MKRGGPIQRKTALKQGGPIERKSALSGGKPMERRGLSSTKRTPASNKTRSVSPANDNRWRSPAYLAWVRALPCSRCGAPADDAHHVIGLHWGLSGMGTTAPDSYAMPVCRACHLDVHRLPELQRYQPNWLRHTIARGVREFGGDIGQALREAWAFIEAKEEAA